MGTQRTTHTRRHVIFALILLVLANILMGIVLMSLSRKTLREQINQRMLDISNTAAYMLNGDELEQLTKEDEATEPYQNALAILRGFQDNIDLSYIYGIRAEPDGSFTFTIDPTVEDPGEFGSPIVSTPALVAASRGTPSVDQKAYSDDWGRFYSAYSPVFNSQGQVAGIVGVDFDADWFDAQMRRNMWAVIVISVLSLAIGIALAYAISRNNRKRFEALNREMTSLEKGFQELNRAMMKSSLLRLEQLPQSDQNDLLKTLASGAHIRERSESLDEFSELSRHLHTMQDSLKHYLSFLDSQTYIDTATGIGNKAAYKRTLEEIAAELQTGSSQFAVGFFDINELRSINSRYGFEVGDTILYAAATILKLVFQQKNVYRVASDEFIVVMRGKTLTDMDGYFAKCNEEIDKFNSLHKVPAKLSVSKGCAVHRREQDEDYRKVFQVAEENQRRDKAAFYAAQDPADRAS